MLGVDQAEGRLGDLDLVVPVSALDHGGLLHRTRYARYWVLDEGLLVARGVAAELKVLCKLHNAQEATQHRRFLQILGSNPSTDFACRRLNPCRNRP